MTIWLENLWKMLENPAYAETIHWNDAGTAIVISSMKELEAFVLVDFGKSPKETFLRNLSHYRFAKQSGLKTMYSHPQFIRANPECVHEIQRPPKVKKGNMMVTDPNDLNPGSKKGRPAKYKPEAAVTGPGGGGGGGGGLFRMVGSPSSMRIPFEGNPEMRIMFLQEENQALKHRIEELETELELYADDDDDDDLDLGDDGLGIGEEEGEEGRGGEEGEGDEGSSGAGHTAADQSSTKNEEDSGVASNSSSSSSSSGIPVVNASSSSSSSSLADRLSRKRPRGSRQSSGFTGAGLADQADLLLAVTGITPAPTCSYAMGGSCNVPNHSHPSQLYIPARSLSSGASMAVGGGGGEGDGGGEGGVVGGDINNGQNSPYPPQIHHRHKLLIREPPMVVDHNSLSLQPPQNLNLFPQSDSLAPSRSNSGSGSVSTVMHGHGGGGIVIRHGSYNPEFSPLSVSGVTTSELPMTIPFLPGGYSRSSSNSSTMSYHHPAAPASMYTVVQHQQQQQHQHQQHQMQLMQQQQQHHLHQQQQMQEAAVYSPMVSSPIMSNSSTHGWSTLVHQHQQQHHNLQIPFSRGNSSHEQQPIYQHNGGGGGGVVIGGMGGMGVMGGIGVMGVMGGGGMGGMGGMGGGEMPSSRQNSGDMGLTWTGTEMKR